MNQAIESFYEQLSNLAPKLITGVERIEMEISRKEEELALLRDALKKAQTILYVVNPDSKPKPKSRRGGSSVPSNGKRVGVSEEKLEQLTEWLRQHPDMATFSGPEIMHADFGLMSEPTLRAGLDVLHERGVITLDSIGGSKQSNRRKNYRLVQT